MDVDATVLFPLFFNLSKADSPDFAGPVDVGSPAGLQVDLIGLGSDANKADAAAATGW